MHVGSPAYFELLIQLTTGEGSSTNASGRSVISLYGKIALTIMTLAEEGHAAPPAEAAEAEDVGKDAVLQMFLL